MVVMVVCGGGGGGYKLDLVELQGVRQTRVGVKQKTNTSYTFPVENGMRIKN
jgi:hypothetical protein